MDRGMYGDPFMTGLSQQMQSMGVFGPEAEVSAIDSEILAGRNADALAKVSDKNVTRKEEIAAIRKVVEGNVYRCSNLQSQVRHLQKTPDAYSTEGLRNRIELLERQWQNGYVTVKRIGDAGMPWWMVIVLFVIASAIGAVAPW